MAGLLLPVAYGLLPMTCGLAYRLACCLLARFVLQTVQLGVQATLLHKPLMLAALDDLSFIHYKDHVSTADGGETVNKRDENLL